MTYVVRQYHQDYYRPDNLCLIITGKIDVDDVIKSLLITEETILSKNSTDGDHVRPWTSVVDELQTSIVDDVQFPAEDEETGMTSYLIYIPLHQECFVNMYLCSYAAEVDMVRLCRIVGMTT